MHRAEKTPEAFAALGLEGPLLRALQDVGYEKPSPIQEELIPLILQGKDVLGQARTGTGKTAAFGLPILQMVHPEERLQAIILTPTRELAVQVLGELKRLAQHTLVHCVPVYGGTSVKDQLHQLGRRPHVVVGTPGRVMDFMERRALDLSALRFAVLDEVDRMLDIGFRDDIQRILGSVRSAHQTVFVSATISDEIKRLAGKYLKDPVEINVSGDKITVEGVAQYFCGVQPWDKFRLLKMLLTQEKAQLTIIFCNTKHAARKLAKRLFAIGIEAKEIHGDLVQQKREKIMDRFKRHKIPVLVATDLASRGIDVHNITHIINYDTPHDPEIYVHRIGRTARMGASGRAITFVTREQGEDLTKIEILINHEVKQLQVAGFEPSPEPSDFERPGGGDFRGGGFRGGGGGGPQPISVSVAQPAPARPGTLGGKFPVSRRRRR